MKCFVKFVKVIALVHHEGPRNTRAEMLKLRKVRFL